MSQQFLLVTSLVACIFMTRAIGKTTCPNDRQCGEKTCKQSEVCLVSVPRCPSPPEGTTLSPSCFPQFECQKIECPSEEPSPVLLNCFEGYQNKTIQLPKCKYHVASCVPKSCGSK